MRRPLARLALLAALLLAALVVPNAILQANLNQVFVACASQAGPRGGWDMLGSSVLIDPRDTDSGRVGAQALAALAKADEVIGLPVEAINIEYADAASLARATDASRIAVLYVTPGFDAVELEAISRALEGHSVLSAGAVAKYTERGTVLGFDLVGGKPKLLVHLARARRQQVELSSAVLKLMTVIE